MYDTDGYSAGSGLALSTGGVSGPVFGGNITGARQPQWAEQGLQPEVLQTMLVPEKVGVEMLSIAQQLRAAPRHVVVLTTLETVPSMSRQRMMLWPMTVLGLRLNQDQKAMIVASAFLE